MTEYYRNILFFIQRMVKDPELAKDLTQETYVKVLEKKDYDTIENKKAYIYRIAKNLVIDKIRKKQKYTEIIYNEETNCIPKEEEIEAVLNKKDDQMLLMQCIKYLPKRNKEAFILNVIKGYTRKEVAQIMNISLNAVEKNIARAAIKIQENLKEKGNHYE